MDSGVSKVDRFVDAYEFFLGLPLLEIAGASAALAIASPAEETAAAGHLIMKFIFALYIGDLLAEVNLVLESATQFMATLLIIGMGQTLPMPFGFVVMGACFARLACRTLKEMQQSLANHPKERLADVVPLGKGKEKIAEVISYLKNPGPFTRIGAKPPSGILLIGPPGTGKTLLAKALVNEMGPYTKFMQVTGSQLKSKWMGESAENIRNLFKEARLSVKEQQRRLEIDKIQNPELQDYRSICVIFIDEIDSFGSRVGLNTDCTSAKQERIDTINEMIAQMDGFTPNDGILVIGTTNDGSFLDPALLSRLPCRINIELPNQSERMQIFEKQLKGIVVDGSVDLEALARETATLSGRDIKSIVEAALWHAATQQMPGVTQEELMRASREFSDARPLDLSALNALDFHEGKSSKAPASS